jgi:hypothetical protein
MIRHLAPLALAATLAHAEVPADYAFGVSLTTESAGPFHRVELPAAVYEGVAQRDLDDLRVFNADGALVPFAWVPRAAAPRERKPAVVLPLFPLYIDRSRGDVAGLNLSLVRSRTATSINIATADGQPVAGPTLGGYVLDATAVEEPLTALAFALPATGASTMRLRIDASDDLATWRPVVADGTLVNLEYAGRRLFRDRIEFAPTKAKYLRLSWPAHQPVHAFSSVSGEFADRAVAMPRQWRGVSGSAAAQRDGDYEYDLAGAFPVDRIAIELPERNSVVPAQLLARATSKEAWQPVAATVFYRLQQPGGEVTNEPVAVAGTGQRYWLLRVDPRSGGLAGVAPRIIAGWQPHDLVFAARGAAPFVLAWGNRTATPGAFPIATLVPGYDSTRGLPADIGDTRAGPPITLGGKQRLREPIDAKRWLLWASLALGALLLGWMAFRLAKEMGLTPATDSRSGDRLT